MRFRGVGFVGALAAACAAAAPAGAVLNPQHAGLQVALRAQGLYDGPIDAIVGPETVAGIRAFQRTHGLRVTGIADAHMRRDLGPFGSPLFGARTISRGEFGWDVAVLQFLLVRHGVSVPVNGYVDGPTVRGIRRYQHELHLAADGIVGPATFAALGLQTRVPVRVSAATNAGAVRASIDRWAARYGVDPSLARALAWMESGYQDDVVSSVGARGIMQLLPSTWSYVETVLLGRTVPHTADGNVEVGVALLHHLLRAFDGNERLALAAWYQGERSVRRLGIYETSRMFVADVEALKSRM